MRWEGLTAAGVDRAGILHSQFLSPRHIRGPRTDVATVLELAEELYRLAERSADPALLVVAHDVMGDTSLMLGRFEASRMHMQRGIRLHDPSQHRRLAYRYGGDDPGIACRSLGAHASWCLGYPDEALRLGREAVALGERPAHPPSQAFALSHFALLHYLRREPTRTLEIAETTVALCKEHDFAFWLAFAAILQGWALVTLHRDADGISLMEQGIEHYRVTGGELERPIWLSMLAEAHRTVGQLAEAVASDQRAKSLELRARLSLAHYRGRIGDRREAQGPLADTYAWFTEGFETVERLLREPAVGEDRHTRPRPFRW